MGILRRGIETWNLWRQTTDTKPDLSHADITSLLPDSVGTVDQTQVDSGRLNFADTNLNRADLRQMILKFPNFEKASMRDAKLQGADLTGANLHDADLSKANVEGTVLAEANLTGADLTETRIWQAKLAGRSFPDAELEISDAPTTITSVNDLLDVVRTVHEELREESYELKLLIYYRGEREFFPQLRPSVLRGSSEFRGGGLKSVEHEMLTDLKTREPNAFQESSSTFADLVLARHHGLPTRLLDVTRNPLVALFNACQDTQPDSPISDGRIHIFAVPDFMVRRFDSDTISVVANFTRLTRGEKNTLLTKTDADIDQYDDDPPGRYVMNQQLQYGYREILSRLRQFIRQEKPHFEDRINPRDLFRVFIVEPQRAFARIRAQSGAFMISANYENLDAKEIWTDKTGLPMHVQCVLPVPKGVKQRILRDLNRLNVSHETLFPGLDSAAASITERFKQR